MKGKIIVIAAGDVVSESRASRFTNDASRVAGRCLGPGQ